MSSSKQEGIIKKPIILMSSVLNFLTIFIRRYSIILKLKINPLTLYIDLLRNFQFIKEIIFFIRKVMINELLYIARTCLLFK